MPYYSKRIYGIFFRHNTKKLYNEKLRKVDLSFFYYMFTVKADSTIKNSIHINLKVMAFTFNLIKLY